MREAKTERSAVSSKQLFSKQHRSVKDVQEERDSGRGYVSAHGDPAIEVMWGWNSAVERDQIFKLRIPYKCEHCGKYHSITRLLDAEEVMKFLRWV